ncbi:hypothetical protein PROFUN_10279 [Planoprotostelium fungivorum]|uniref:Myosin-binding domain-containing protein n=1 Tax=Planoprotostelium fungivorum TaxID=1890364 RepID=A0A2P6MRP9_9EUKA|nr:hypothetical protein PROFUN_10279 [Planoprotostelium fungivorum]
MKTFSSLRIHRWRNILQAGYKHRLIADSTVEVKNKAEHLEGESLADIFGSDIITPSGPPISTDFEPVSLEPITSNYDSRLHETIPSTRKPIKAVNNSTGGLYATYFGDLPRLRHRGDSISSVLSKSKLMDVDESDEEDETEDLTTQTLYPPIWLLPLLPSPFFVLSAHSSLIIVFIFALFLFFPELESIDVLNQYVTLSYQSDLLVNKSLRWIREADLLYNGYRISHPLHHISRLENDSSNKATSRLRRQLHDYLIALLHCLSPSSPTSQNHSLVDIKESQYEMLKERAALTKKWAEWDEENQTKASREITGIVREMNEIMFSGNRKLIEILEYGEKNRKGETTEEGVKERNKVSSHHQRFCDQTESLVRHLESICSRIQLCQQLLPTTEDGEQIDELIVQYGMVRNEVTSTLRLWEAGNHTLYRMIEDPTGLPTVQWEERMRQKRDTKEREEGQIIDVEAQAALQRSTLDVPEQDFEAYTGPLEEEEEYTSEEESEEETMEGPSRMPSILSMMSLPLPAFKRREEETFGEEEENGSEYDTEQKEIKRMKGRRVPSRRDRPTTSRRDRIEERRNEERKKERDRGEDMEAERMHVIQELRDVLVHRKRNKEGDK